MLYKEDLDGMKPFWEDAENPHSNCHGRTPTWIEYLDGALKITCTKCRTVIAQIAVATKPVPKPPEET